MSPPNSTRTAAGKSIQQIRIYIDNSNVWIQGQRASAEKHRLQVKLDPTWRFDAGRLQNVLTQNCGLPPDEETTVIVDLYGSTPPPVDTIWKAIESHNVTVHTFERSSWTGREKEVDAEIIAASVSDAADLFHAGVSSTFIIVSGDKDLLRAVLRIAARGFEVHVWSWRNALSGVYKEPKRQDCCELMDKGFIKIHLLDDFFDEISFYETEFRIDKSTIRPDSIVILNPLPQADMVHQVLANLLIPFRPYRMQRQGASQEDLVIIPACELDHRSHTEIFQGMREKLNQHGLGVMTYLDYNSNQPESPQGDLIASNPFKKLEMVDTIEVGDGQDDEGFKVVKKRQKQQSKRLKTEEKKLYNRCQWRKYCKEGLDCKHGHTKEETDYFKTYGKQRATKFAFCQDNECIRGKRCRYAHEQEELFCPTCGKTGAHEMRNCPEKTLGSIQRYAS
ncbi:hypothetical protein ACHAPT_005480 [Fusarium lateritium]